MDKICLIKQPAGIGDIFFCQKIAKIIQMNTDYKRVVWPVRPIYSYIKEYLISKDIDFVDESSDFPYKHIYSSNIINIIKDETLLYLPLETANQKIKKCSCHNSSIAFGHIKYDFCGIKHDDWLNFFEFKRNYDREERLIKHLNIDINRPYNIINKNYGTYPHFLTRSDIQPRNGFPNVAMNFIADFNLFDWLKIIEHASEIHTVTTSILFILEKMQIKNVHAYSRHQDKNPDSLCDVKSKNNTSWVFYD